MLFTEVRKKQIEKAKALEPVQRRLPGLTGKELLLSLALY